MKKQIDTMTKDVDSYSKEEYELIEKDLESKINSLLESFEKEYLLQPLLTLRSLPNRVNVEILNKSLHNINT